MAEQLGDLTRTHTCGALRTTDVGTEVVLLGWVHRVRDLGGLLFVDVRDRDGLTQVVFDKDDETLMGKAKRLRSEFVIGVSGRVRRRSEETINPKLETGEVEVVVQRLTLLNEAKTPPFPVADDTPVSEDVRLKYRYLDLRRPRLQSNIVLRHRVTSVIRKYFDANGFLEIETPILTKSTPEGARDYLVPSRVHPGEFFALPQSPQLFKQILMIAGMDRYVQICKCFRDEDLRADRQPEFTQVDVEMSFARPDTIFDMIEPLMRDIFDVIGRTIETPFPRMAYADAIAVYGSDKPDLRCGMPIQDLREVFRESGFRVFKEIVAGGGTVRGFVVPNAAGFSRSEVDGIVDQAKQLGAAGLIWARRAADGTITSSIQKALGEDGVRQMLDAATTGNGELLLVAAGEPDATSKLLGQLRLSLAKKAGLLKPDTFAFTWVVDFPLLDWDAADNRFVAMHHPFTSPHDEDAARMLDAPGTARAKAYDLVLNGSEIGGGSIRIHDAALQSRVFSLLNISPEEAKARFGFFLEALEYGTPPHGGIALGLDRILAILANESSIREVIAFPKTATAVDLMSDAPSAVDTRQLKELHLKFLMKKIALPEDGLDTLYGAHDSNLKHIESVLRVHIRTQGSSVLIEGEPADEQRAAHVFEQLKALLDEGYRFGNGEVRTAAELLKSDPSIDLRDYFVRGQKQGTRRRVNPKSVNQRKYLDAIDHHDIVFGVGPAGTGKTYLAMAQAVNYLVAKKVSRIILARPAVEAGEKLGFLPGDLQEKVNPYLRPLADALYDMMDSEKAVRLVERGTIEVAPIAFMRGRTLNDAFVILDEAQNTTSEQMKMFLTRLGFGSKAVVTGDITQIDLPNPKASGLVQALSIVKNVEGIGFVYFDDSDVVRHKLVQQIVRAYDAWSNGSKTHG